MLRCAICDCTEEGGNSLLPYETPIDIRFVGSEFLCRPCREAVEDNVQDLTPIEDDDIGPLDEGC